MDTVYRKARQGDVRFVLILEKWGLLSGNTDSGGSDRPIPGLDNSLRGVSTAELEERVRKATGKLLSVVGRPSRFSENGKLSSTLEIREATEDEGIKQEPWIPLPRDAEPQTVLEVAEEIPEELPEPGSPSGEQVVEKPVRGPAISFPQSEVAHL
jgi:hypothetical protein